MKKKILIVLSIVILIIVIALGYAVVIDFKQEDKLKKELTKISELINSDNINIEEINKRLANTITKGDYRIVEESYKQYLKETFENSLEIKTALNNENISDILTANNYINDGPDFIKTKQYINKTKETLRNCKEKYNEFLTEEKVMSYIKDKDLDSYYIDFFRNEIIGDMSTENQDVIVNNAINDIINILEKSDNIIDFLITNKGNWKINENSIEFNSDNLANQYNKMLDSIILETTQEHGNIFNKDFGSYEIANDWIESKEHSTKDKFFYVKKGQEKEQRPNNISINVGKNKYKTEEHDKFRIAIMQQLSMQMSGKDATIKANGSNTKNNYILYTFVIHEEKENITTTQYYIIGDYKYVLVHETTYGDSKETDDVTREILDSFKWNI